MNRNDTAVVFIDPQNEVLSEKGAAWAAVGDSVKEGQILAELDKEDLQAQVRGAKAALEAEDFIAAMAALASLRRPIDDFFDHVTVNDDDPGKRERRLNLLMRFRDAVNRVADFAKIEG